ncbi:unnamed protein product [Paramecium octaurelia]|uniref:Transmembrane protein n=1 Tax=Paramecium octaurelia TaxID=43137 RepID=A0A8S1TIJ9_PAROT|nr:unnamed protein product [Paramecium octaurelia]
MFDSKAQTTKEHQYNSLIKGKQELKLEDFLQKKQTKICSLYFYKKAIKRQIFSKVQSVIITFEQHNCYPHQIQSILTAEYSVQKGIIILSNFIKFVDYFPHLVTNYVLAISNKGFFNFPYVYSLCYYGFIIQIISGNFFIIKIFDKQCNTNMEQLVNHTDQTKFNYMQSGQNNAQITPFTMFQEFDSMSNKIKQQMDNQLANLGFGSIFRDFGNLENEMMEFSNLHRHMKNLNQMEVNSNAQDGVFQVYSSCYVQQSKLGPDGKIIQEKYFDNNAVARGVNGHTISERQQGYKNSDGIDRFAHERMMNDKGRKYIRERDWNGQITTTNHYMNIEEEQVEQFENEWKGLGQQLGISSISSRFNPLQEKQPLTNSNYRPFLQEQLTYSTPSRYINGNQTNQFLDEIQPNLINNRYNQNNNPSGLTWQQSNEQVGIQNRVPCSHQALRALPPEKQSFRGFYQNKGAISQYPYSE